MANEFNKQITKPSQITTIAVLCLVDGILNIAYGLIAFVFTFLGNLLALLVSLYCLTLGILEIRYAIGLFSDPPKVARPAQYIPIMQIINVLTLNVFTLFLGSPIIGVVVLALHRNDEIRNYFQWRQSLSPIQLEKSSPEALVHKYFLAPLMRLIWHSCGIFPPLCAKNRPKLGTGLWTKIPLTR